MKGLASPCQCLLTSQVFSAITWPHLTLALTKAAFAEVDGCCWITLHASWLAVLVVEVLIQGLNLGEADRVGSAPDEEMVMVGTVPTCDYT